MPARPPGADEGCRVPARAAVCRRDCRAPAKAAALPPSTSWWTRKLGTLYASVDSSPATHHPAPAQIEALARQLEAVTVEAAFDRTAPTGLHAGAADDRPAAYAAERDGPP